MPDEAEEPIAILVSNDLLARSRLEGAGSRAGWRVDVTTPERLEERLAQGGAQLLVLDLDAGGRDLLDRVADAGGRNDLPRVVGFFSHVDTELAAAAKAAGCDAMPRGKFWRSLAQVLS